MPGKRQTHSRWAIFLVMLWICLPVIAYSQEIQHKTLPDGVIRYYHSQKERKPWFFRQVENLFNVLLPNENELPFGKSVAFLVGVSRYEFLSPQLPFVKNDLEALREYLLGHGGFDEVYVAAEEIVTYGLVERYMFSNRFPSKLGNKDRLLFYYSGHGADLGGNTGYLQFSKFQPDDDPNQRLAIDRCREWSKVLPASHVLFIFDCCVSGLAFTKEGFSDSRADILRTLGGERSRMVISAGTGKQISLGLPDKRSVFTDAFLNALKKPRTEDCFVTITQIFAQVESEVGMVARTKGRTQTPIMESLETGGKFLFIDTSSPKKDCLSQDAKERLKAIDKGSDVRRAEVAPPKTEPEPVAEVPKERPEPQPQAKKPRYQLRKEPMAVLYEDALKIFTLNELSKDFWIPLEYIKNDFKENGEKTITDYATGLMWQKSGSDKRLMYEDAKAYIDGLNNKKFAGYKDWRLPTVNELKSLMTPKEMNRNLYIDPIFDKEQRYIWTSDTCPSGMGWYVNFYMNSVSIAYYAFAYDVRAVRSLTPRELNQE